MAAARRPPLTASCNQVGLLARGLRCLIVDEDEEGGRQAGRRLHVPVARFFNALRPPAAQGHACCTWQPSRHRLPATYLSSLFCPPGDPGLVGVFAQLATVDDPQLSGVLAANLRGLLSTVCVADVPARQRLASLLAKLRLPAPDMLPLTMQTGQGGKAGDCPGFAAADERAHALQRAACRGADPPVSAPLPHTRAIGNLRERGEQIWGT